MHEYLCKMITFDLNYKLTRFPFMPNTFCQCYRHDFAEHLSTPYLFYSVWKKIALINDLMFQGLILVYNKYYVWIKTLAHTNLTGTGEDS